MKKVSTTKAAAQNAPSTASGFAKNVYAKYYQPGLYTKYEPLAQHYAVSTWRSLNQLPIFPTLAQLVLPTAAYCSDKYNHTVLNTAEKGYKVASYLPLVPVGKIVKLFNAHEESDDSPKPILHQSATQQGPLAAA